MTEIFRGINLCRLLHHAETMTSDADPDPLMLNDCNVLAVARSNPVLIYNQIEQSTAEFSRLKDGKLVQGSYRSSKTKLPDFP